MVKQLKSLTFVNDNISNTYQVSSDTNPDWNQNDETAADYVKNRTHWIGDPELVTIIEETTAEMDICAETPEIEFVAGQVYLVNWNGAEYECTAWADDSGYVYLGNGNIYGGAGKGEDVPFCFETGYVNVAEAGTYTFSVTTTVRKYYPIDERFLPPVIGRPGTGENAEVFNDYSLNHASGFNSHAEGYGTTASGERSHAEGYCTTASGKDSHAEGRSTIASRWYAHAEGMNTVASGYGSHAEGHGTTILIPITGDAGSTSYTLSSNATYMPDIGDFIYWNGVGSFVVGRNPDTETITLKNTLDANNALTETKASCSTGGIAKGNYSHVEGCGNKAISDYQHVQGKYNVYDADGKYAHIVGNGTKDARSNAHTIDWDGNAWFAGKVYVGGTGQDDENATEVATLANSEEWVFTLEDGSTITKKVVLG